jgi:putative oxidoreductase
MQILDQLKPLGLLLLRAALGVIFIFNGYPKLFPTTHRTMQYFAHVGLPEYFVYIAGVLEFFGGILLIVGLFTRLAAFLLAGEMVVALWKVHGLFSHPMDVKNYEFPLVVAAGAFALATVGAGLISLDRIVFGESRGNAPRKPKGRD